MQRYQTLPFYNVSDDDFYHGPAWVIKPRLFPSKPNLRKTPGPSHYRIPERSIYDRPGKTIGNRYETTSSTSPGLLAHYSPNDHYTSKAKMPAISITPRRIERMQTRGYSQHFYLPSDRTIHSHGPTISRKSLDHNLSLNSPGPAAYPMYEFDEDILPRPQPGVTQKHRLSFDRLSAIPTNPPFYYPKKIDQRRLPSFTIGRRLYSTKKINPCTVPYYSSFDNRTLCSSVIKPGVTLKGRWSPLVCTLKT